MGKVIFHVDEEDARIAKEDEVLDCNHKVVKNDTYYDLFEHDELPPVMAVCKNCVVVYEKKEE
jgi:uncharacterized protein YifN (PemK superfamily)